MTTNAEVRALRACVESRSSGSGALSVDSATPCCGLWLEAMSELDGPLSEPAAQDATSRLLTDQMNPSYQKCMMAMTLIRLNAAPLLPSFISAQNP